MTSVLQDNANLHYASIKLSSKRIYDFKTIRLTKVHDTDRNCSDSSCEKSESDDVFVLVVEPLQSLSHHVTEYVNEIRANA